MLRNAVPIVSGDLEPVFGYDKRRIELQEQFPSDNYDWRKSGLYNQIYQKFQKDKEQALINAT
jgi:hypothetical protein